MYRYIDIKIYRYMDIDRQIDRQIDKDRQIDRQIDGYTYINRLIWLDMSVYMYFIVYLASISGKSNY